MIKKSVGKILEASQALREVNNMDMPIAAALKWNKNVKEIDEVLKVFNERREKMFNEFAEEVEPDEDGKSPGKRVPEERMEEFSKAVEEIIQEEVELNIQKMDIASFGNVTVKPAVLGQLEWILDY